MKKTAPRYKFCPECGHALVARNEGNVLASCPNGDFAQFDNPKPCVAVLIISNRDEVLLGKRAVEPQKGFFDILGGFIDSGESAEEAVRREIKEETGLTITTLSYLTSLPDVYGEKNTPTLNFCFAAEVEGAHAPGSDVQSLHWFPIANPPELAFSHQRIALEYLRTWRKKLKRASASSAS